MSQGDREGLLSIGQLSGISQISVKTLRYYDEEGILKPAHVDELSRYRYYTAEQVEQARLLQNLRFAQVPLEDLREFMRDPTYEHQAQVFDQHIERLRKEVQALNSSLRTLTRRRDYPWHPQVYEVQAQVRRSVPFIYVHERVGLGDIEDARDATFSALSAHLSAHGIRPVSPLTCFSLPDPTRRGKTPDAHRPLVFYAGVELQTPAAETARFKMGSTPAGVWYGTRHVGLYEYMGHTKAPVFQRAREDGLLLTDDPSAALHYDFIHAQVFWIGPWACTDLSRLETEVRWLLKMDTPGSLRDDAGWRRRRPGKHSGNTEAGN